MVGQHGRLCGPWPAWVCHHTDRQGWSVMNPRFLWTFAMNRQYIHISHNALVSMLTVRQFAEHSVWNGSMGFFLREDTVLSACYNLGFVFVVLTTVSGDVIAEIWEFCCHNIRQSKQQSVEDEPGSRSVSCDECFPRMTVRLLGFVPLSCSF